MLRDAWRIPAPIDNFVELAETLSLVDLVILGDAMVRRGFCTIEDLVAGVAASGPRRGVRMARRAAALVRPHVDSPMETGPERILMRVQKALAGAGHVEVVTTLNPAWRQHLLPSWTLGLVEPPGNVDQPRSA